MKFKTSSKGRLIETRYTDPNGREDRSVPWSMQRTDGASGTEPAHGHRRSTQICSKKTASREPDPRLFPPPVTPPKTPRAWSKAVGEMNEGSRCRPADALQTPRQSDACVVAPGDQCGQNPRLSSTGREWRRRACATAVAKPTWWRMVETGTPVGFWENTEFFRLYYVFMSCFMYWNLRKIGGARQAARRRRSRVGSSGAVTRGRGRRGPQIFDVLAGNLPASAARRRPPAGVLYREAGPAGRAPTGLRLRFKSGFPIHTRTRPTHDTQFRYYRIEI